MECNTELLSRPMKQLLHALAATSVYSPLFSSHLHFLSHLCILCPGHILLLSYCLDSKSCWTLWDPMDYSRPGSSVHGILQARILRWVAISLSRGSSQPRDQNSSFLPWQVDSLLLSHQRTPLLLGLDLNIVSFLKPSLTMNFPTRTSNTLTQAAQPSSPNQGPSGTLRSELLALLQYNQFMIHRSSFWC